MTLDDYINGLPDDLWYCADNDLWLRQERGQWRLGANAFVTHYGKFMVFYPKPIGTQLDKGDAMGVMETWKTAFGIAAPFPCVIEAANPKAVEDIESVKQSPYDDGWLFCLSATATFDPADRFMTKQQYADWCRGKGAQQFEQLLPSNDPDDLIYDPLRGI